MAGKNSSINSIMSGLQNKLGGNRPMTKPAPDGAKPEYTTQLRPGAARPAPPRAPKPGPMRMPNQAAPPVLGGGAETFTGPKMPAAPGGAKPMPMPKPGAPTRVTQRKPRPMPMPGMNKKRRPGMM